MKCTACGANNRSTAKFCDECGARLGMAAAVPEQKNYTPKHLADKILKSRSAMEGEKKRVTVLFCDVKDSTRLAEAAGAEAWHHILDRFFSILSTAVHQYEGTVNQYTGDGIMALFGAPIAHEDHAELACLAALQMQDDLKRYATQIKTSHGLDLRLRVGINSGEVIVGRIGDDLRMDYTAQGATTHLAARMEQLCEPGKIYLSRYSAALVQHRFQLLALGEHRVAGVAHPLGVFELQGEATETAQAAGVRTPFVGRAAERQQLDNALQQVRNGAAVTMAVTGAAGLGKSRLCREFGAACQSAGVPFYRATCLPYSRALPLRPIRRLLRQRLDIHDATPPEKVRAIAEAAFSTYTRSDRAQLQPLWLEFLGVRDENLHASTQTPGLRARLLEQVLRHLLQTPCPAGVIEKDSRSPALAHGAAQVLLVEDLHWADTATEEFLAQLARHADAGRTLLLLNYRPDRELNWLPPGRHQTLTLAEFGSDELEQLSRELLGTHPSLGMVMQRVRERTGGNPFFFEEAVRDLLAAGYLGGAPARYELARPIEEWTIPDTVHALLAARMDRLPDEQKRLLQTAAVIGQRFNQGLLAQVLDVESAQITPAIVALESAGFVRARPDAGASEFAYCHPLMQEVAYQSQLETHRRSIHALLAANLQLRYPADQAPSEHWVTIAHHWGRAGDWLRSGIWNLRAVQWASNWDVGVMREQVRAAVAAFDRAPDSAEVSRQRVLARSALVRMAVHADVPLDETEAAYQQGKRIARERRDLRSHADLLLSYGVDWLHRGDADAACALTTQSARLVRVAAEGATDYSFAEYLLYTHNTAGRLEEGEALCSELLGGDWTGQPITAHNYRARAEHAALMTYRGQLRAARADFEAILAVSPSDDNSAAWIRAFLVDWALFSGDDSRAMEDAQQALKRAEAFGSPQHRAHAMRAIAGAACLSGQHEAALAPLDEARALYANEHGLAIFRSAYLVVQAEAWRGVGEGARAAAAAEEAIALAHSQHARIQEMMGWAMFLTLPRQGPWAPRMAYGLTRFEELLAYTGATVFLPWLCQSQARWAAREAERMDWLQQTAQHFAAIGADGYLRRLGATL